MRSRPTLDQTETLGDYIWISVCEDNSICEWNLTLEEFKQLNEEVSGFTFIPGGCLVGVTLRLVECPTMTGPVRRKSDD